MSDDAHVVRSRIWQEEPEPDNPYVARAAYCRGFDVFGEMLGQSRWVDMLYLLFREEPPTRAEADLLETAAVALANPGPRDPAVHAAMCGGVCGSTAASSLIAALAVGAGGFGGGREVFRVMQGWDECGLSLESWAAWMKGAPSSGSSVWPAPEHPPGFDPNGVTTATPVRQTLECLARMSPGPRLAWLEKNLDAMETAAGLPIALSAVAAAAFSDLNFNPEQGEMLHLLLRLPGAAAHALEQRPLGYKKFPFGTVELETDAQEAK